MILRKIKKSVTGGAIFTHTKEKEFKFIHLYIQNLKMFVKLNIWIYFIFKHATLGIKPAVLIRNIILKQHKVKKCNLMA